MPTLAMRHSSGRAGEERPVMGRTFPVKRLPDCRAMLNIGCGTKMDWQWNNVDYSPYARLAHHPFVASLLHRVGLLSHERYETLALVDPSIVNWNLLHGIPFKDNTFDVVYHSHFLEHIDRDYAPCILKECHRVLKRDGSLRNVVPDLYSAVMFYVSSVVQLENGDQSSLKRHQEAIDGLFEQMVRRQPSGAKLQRGWVRVIERLFRGDAVAAGEVHRWMYDKHSLERLLSQAGFREVTVATPFSSRIHGWSEFELDLNGDGTVYKAYSLYMEAIK
jgi:SAM-dependent methyltransferase